ATGLDEQPVQARHREARRLDDAAQSLRFAGVDELGRFGEREGRDLEPFVAEERRELALLLERQGAEHLVAERKPHVMSSRRGWRLNADRSSAPAPPVAYCTAALNAGT